MPNSQLRMNVRNLLVGATMTDMQFFRDNATARGDTKVADYAKEFIQEVLDE